MTSKTARSLISGRSMKCDDRIHRSDPACDRQGQSRPRRRHRALCPRPEPPSMKTSSVSGGGSAAWRGNAPCLLTAPSAPGPRAAASTPRALGGSAIVAPVISMAGGKSEVGVTVPPPDGHRRSRRIPARPGGRGPAGQQSQSSLVSGWAYARGGRVRERSLVAVGARAVRVSS